MTDERWRELNKSGRGLTKEESAEGWHFCDEWDGLLIGPGWPELEFCKCLENENDD